MDFYLYRDNYVVKVGEGTEQLLAKLQSQGYELFQHPLPTQDQARAAQQLWQEQIDRRREQGLF